MAKKRWFGSHLCPY